VFETVYCNFKGMDLADIQADYESITGDYSWKLITI
jgi:hypothetical protein